MWNLEKMVQMNLLAVQEYTGRYTEQTCGHEGRGEEGEMNWESTIDKYTLLLPLLLSHFSRVRLCVTPWTAAHQAPPSMGFSRQE